MIYRYMRDLMKSLRSQFYRVHQRKLRLQIKQILPKEKKVETQ